MQQMFEPLAYCEKDDEGTLVLQLSDKDFGSFKLGDEEKLRAKFEQINERREEYDREQLEAEERNALINKLE